MKDGTVPVAKLKTKKCKKNPRTKLTDKQRNRKIRSFFKETKTSSKLSLLDRYFGNFQGFCNINRELNCLAYAHTGKFNLGESQTKNSCNTIRNKISCYFAIKTVT